MRRRDFPEILEKRLQTLNEASCWRSLSQRTGVDFCSNDYLGISTDVQFKQRISKLIQDALNSKEGSLALGATGSRLLRGQQPIFEKAETFLAEFCGRESALLFATGYQANVGLFSALLKPGDLVFSDEFNHASIIDGIRLSGAQKRIYPHCDLKTLRQSLESENHQNTLKVIVTESIFSMDGDLAPLSELADLAEEFSALLVVDEAHATGLWGSFDTQQGGGWVQALGLSDRVFATVHPAGKAMGLGGAWICGDERLKDYLINCSRSFIYSTAPIPLLGLLLIEAIQYWKEVGPQRAKTVLRYSNQLQSQLSEVFENSNLNPRVPGPIVPVVIGSSEKTQEVARFLQDLGLDIRAIRPPTVPSGKSRLRITLNWNHSESDIQLLSQGLQRVLR
jgi:8-amino-7-oxononanoate synthase